MDTLLNFFSGKRVLVTGHTGFKGSWLAFILSEAGAKVGGYALAPQTNPNHFNLLNLSGKIEHHIGDIRDLNSIRKVVDSFKPEIVFHLAAQALVRRSYADPVDTFSTNMMGSVNLLEAIRHCETIQSLVYITSDKCYENLEWVWGYRETDMMGGHDPYSASKAAAEIIYSAYYRSYLKERANFGAASARAGNVIGGGDWSEDRIIPDCIRSIQNNEQIKIRSPKATRPWQHVLEPLSGYLLLAKKLLLDPKKYSGSWNFGPTTQKTRTVLEIATSIVTFMGKGEIQVTDDEKKYHEAHLLQLNCDKAHQYLDWYPRWDVDATVEATAAWYKTVLEGGEAEAVTRQQINAYFSGGNHD